MIEVIIGIDKDLRNKKRQEILKGFTGEIIALNDLNTSLVALEDYVYPSLFTVTPPIVYATYLIEEDSSQLTKELLKKIISSPTIFVLEERAVSSPVVKLIEKEGGLVHQIKEGKKVARPSTIFGVAEALTLSSKKDRWLAYQRARQEHAPEALIGILYWKLRQLVEKPGAQASHYKNVYRDLIQAHKESWQKGFPLELAIEKVILEQ
ncbi:MAG: hypothetical protein AAB681_00440 [Patescibacteria group bacterium]